MSFSGVWVDPAECCPTNQTDIPAPVGNLLIFELTGYNYRALPEWYDLEGQRMMAIQSSIISDLMLYRWKFYRKDNKPCGDGGMGWYLVTSDDIVPTIFELTSRRRMHVRRVRRHNGYTTWLVSC